MSRGSSKGDAAPVTHVVADRVATITLADHEARNVLTPTVISELSAAFERAAADDDVRVVVLTAEGSTFCAGADLRGASTGSEGSFASDAQGRLAALLTRIIQGAKPVVARVQGHVAGGGNGLVAACDLVVAADSAKFAFSEVRVGVAPAVISTVCLRRMPPALASELFLTGERISAGRAKEAGLVHQVVPETALDAAVDDYVGALLLGGPNALARTKELLNRVPTLSLTDGFTWTTALSSELFASEEAAEGMAAFLARRPPSWA